MMTSWCAARMTVAIGRQEPQALQQGEGDDQEQRPSVMMVTLAIIAVAIRQQAWDSDRMLSVLGFCPRDR